MSIFKTFRVKRLLLVDDDHINIIVLTKYVELFKECPFDVAFNGKEAVELVRKSAEMENYYDVIFMDCNMPIMDGFETTKIILEMARKNLIKSVPIIATTANVSPLDRDYCFKCGKVDYLARPLTKSQIREKIDKYASY